MKSTPLHALAYLRQKTVSSSFELARALSVSQQTASRWLSDLSKENLLERKSGMYRLTVTGATYLGSLFSPVQNALKGTVFAGLGEGKYYLGKPGYKKQFPGLLGFEPYPGTLNLRLADPSDKAALIRLRAGPGLFVRGFEEKDRTFGAARCYPVSIQGKIKGAVIVPERTHYPLDVVELLAPVYLRKALGLKDGDVVSLESRT